MHYGFSRANQRPAQLLEMPGTDTDTESDTGKQAVVRARPKA
ncbi:hypothetical protein [Streptomyces klenkii]